MSRSNRSWLVGVALAAVALALSVPGWAQEGRKTDFSSTVTVQEVDAAGMRLVVDESGAPKTLFTEAKTEILDGSRHIALADLARGDRITVDATFEGPRPGGRLIADRIVVVRDPAAPSR